MKSINNSIHWEPVQCPNKALEYVQKEDTRIEGPWSFGSVPHTGRPKLSGSDVTKMSLEEIDELPLA